jgi:hypothetical protein
MTRTLQFVVLATLAASAACGGDDGGSPSNRFDLDHTTLDCPDDTLVITDLDGRFPAGTTVSFDMDGGSVSLDGDAVILDDGTIACGLPEDAPPGQYNIKIYEPGQTSVDGGTITLASDTCPS